MKLPLNEKEDLILDLKELSLDGKFYSLQDTKAKSVIHLQAVDRHRDLLSKYTPESLREYILPPQEVPENEYAAQSPPRSFMSMIKLIIASLTLKPELLLFKFDISRELLEFNQKILENFDFDMEKLILSFKNNIISPGSEFHYPILLASLIQLHKY